MAVLQALIVCFVVALQQASCLALGSHARSLRSTPNPSQWKRVRLAENDTIIDLHIGLKHGGSKELLRHLSEVSDPRHKRYGQHLSKNQVENLVRPSPDTVSSVQAWLQHNGIAEFAETATQDWITAPVPVRDVEKLLNCEYHEFVHVEMGARMIRTLEWSIPGHLDEHIDVIQPTNSFFRAVPQDRYGGVPPPEWDVEGRLPTYDELVEEDMLDRGHIDMPDWKDMPAHPTVAEACNRIVVSPLCLRVLYGTLDYEAKSMESNKMGVVNFLGQNSNRSDIAQYLERYRPDAAAAGAANDFQTVLVAGAIDQQTPNTEEQLDAGMGREGALDVETLLGIGYPTPLVTWNVGGQPPWQQSTGKTENSNEPFLEWLRHVLAEDTLPQVISISYADEEQTVPPEYAKRVCEGFAQLGARGVSVIVAAGDDGVGKEGTCFSNDGRNQTRFLPTFPASCPYVTAVGATRHFDPVMAAFDAKARFVTGGGFSEHFDRPWYQEPDVQPYVTGMGSEYEGFYRPEGRGIPDVSAMGYHFSIIWDGVAHLMDGTSASAPAFAAIVALLNDALLAEGRPPLGFLNPWIYGQGRAGFRDVTAGSNHGCGTLGFQATKGWDAATGLGTPWFPALKELALQTSFRWQRPWYMDWI